MLSSFTVLLFCLFTWWRDVIREGTFEGNHTRRVQIGLRLGMALFIVSEVMFFVSFFWAFGHSSISPSIEVGNIWPPKGIIAPSMWGLPLLNTVILLSSGYFLVWSHHSILANRLKPVIDALAGTIALAFIFIAVQGFEYKYSPFSISDGIYGSTFFLTTGFHGIHVILGTAFLIVCFIRLILGQFRLNQHIGFESASWYWHFVDVVWIFLYLVFYWWGN
jgi:cytochrome c oxidase subunit 3